MNRKQLHSNPGVRGSLTAALLFLVLPFLLPTSAGAYMAILRQGVDSAEVPNDLDHYGYRVATGDFNGDGYEDIAVAAPHENNDIGVGRRHGVVIVSYGSARGIVHTGASVLSVGAPDDFHVNFGYGLAAGDFNGDGVDDLAVGVPGLGIIGADDVGSVWVYAGIDGVGISLAPYIQLFQEDCGATSEAGDQFGYTLAAGDMTLDGYDDLFVSAIGEDDNAGLVAFFRGSAAGITPAGSGFAKQSGLGGTNDPDSYFGYSLAVGDFLDDGHLEIAIGTPYGHVGSMPDVGKVYIVRGTSVGPVATGGEVVTPISLGFGIQAGSAFGWSLAAGHFFDKWGRPDLAIGEPLFDLPGIVTTCRVVVFDYDDGPTLAPVVLTQADVLPVAQAGASFGWSLAAGNIMDYTGVAGPDDYMDLAVGAPLADVLVPGSNEAMYWNNAGSVYLFPGIGNGFVKSEAKVIDATERNDLFFGFDEKMGWSVAFGKFDSTGWDNLAIGVPNKRYPAFIDADTEKLEAGQVYVMAPWRQPAGRPHRGSVVFDCENRIYYAQRPMQRLTPASTTKAVTALIAVEAIANGEVDPDQMFQIPAWVANNVTGSQYGLFPGEWISFIDLVRVMIAVSGNDASYAIGDILTGGNNQWDDNMSTSWNLENILSTFAQRMNNRAAQIGMSPAHTFNNPAGRPVGQHWTTPYDMALFVDAAMDNEDFREIVGTGMWNNVRRLIPESFIFPALWPSMVPMQFFDNVGNGYFTGIQGLYPTAAGVKGGSNGPSMVTGLYSAELNNGYSKVTVFGIPPYGALGDLGAELMSLVSADCQPKPIDPSHIPTLPVASATHTGIPTREGSAFGATAQIDPEQPGDTAVSIWRRDEATPTTCVQAVIERSTELVLPANGTHASGASCTNNLKQIGIAIHNYSDAVVRLGFFLAQTQYSATISLNPGETWELPTEEIPADAAPQWDFVVNNLSAVDPARIMIEELGYELDLTLGTGRPYPKISDVTLKRGVIGSASETVRVALRGCDPEDGNTVDLSIHSSLGSTSVDGDDAPGVPTTSAGALRTLQNHPNPFNPRTVVSFEVAREAEISLKIYDVAGRLVKVLESGRRVAPGLHQVSWNGTDDGGRSVASGVYLARVEDGSSVLTKSMMLLK
jgi:hypothetical protein